MFTTWCYFVCCDFDIIYDKLINIKSNIFIKNIFLIIIMLFFNISLETSKDDINVKNFLQIFINDNIRKLKILQFVFNDNYVNIEKYIDPPNKLDINKFNKCTKFFNNYSDYLKDNYEDSGYTHLYNAMVTVVEYFGGISEYNKIMEYFKKIHYKYIGQDLAKIHKIYPKYFPKFKKASSCFFKLFVKIEFRLNSYLYKLCYIDKYWTFIITNNNTCKNVIYNTSIEEIIKYIKINNLI